MSHQASLATAKLYKSTIDEVMSGVREAFMDEGIDEQILQELKQTWEAKVLATKAVDTLSDHLPTTAASTSSGAHHHRAHHPASHSSSSSNALSANATGSNHSSATNVIHTAPSASVVVAAPTVSSLGAAAAATGGFPHLAAQRVFQSAAAAQMPAPFAAAFQSGVLAAGAGQGLIIPGNVPVRFINAAQLPTIPAQLMQINQNAQRGNGASGQNGALPQADGPAGISDDEDEFADEEDLQEPVDEIAETGGVEEGEPLNSEDDVSNEDAEEMFEADNVVVCQYEKVTRTRNKWKFVLKDGVMNLDGKDYVFNRATGEAEF